MAEQNCVQLLCDSKGRKDTERSKNPYILINIIINLLLAFQWPCGLSVGRKLDAVFSSLLAMRLFLGQKRHRKCSFYYEIATSFRIVTWKLFFTFLPLRLKVFCLFLCLTRLNLIYIFWKQFGSYIVATKNSIRGNSIKRFTGGIAVWVLCYTNVWSSFFQPVLCC